MTEQLYNQAKFRLWVGQITTPIFSTGLIGFAIWFFLMAANPRENTNIEVSSLIGLGIFFVLIGIIGWLLTFFVFPKKLKKLEREMEKYKELTKDTNV